MNWNEQLGIDLEMGNAKKRAGGSSSQLFLWNAYIHTQREIK